MSAHLATEVRWNITVIFIAIRDKIISSKLISYLKMSQMREKAFIILQDWVPKRWSEERKCLQKTRNCRVNKNRYWTTVYFDWYFWAILPSSTNEPWSVNVSPSFVTEIFESCENTKETHFENVPDVIDETDLNRIYSLASNQLLPLELRIAFTTVGQLAYKVSWTI